MRRPTRLSLLATSLTMAAALHDDARAQQGYGYPEQSGPAAPSTIPGQGDSSARVPVVNPAPPPMPKPRKPKPGAKPSPWGSAPPVASQPPTETSPGSGGNPPPPAQGTPTPSQPQGGASDRLTGTFRGSPGVGGGAISRKGDASGSGIDASAQRTTSTALACTQNGNTPKITRIRVDNETALQPGGTFIVEGLCFGDAKGSVQVTLPTQYGRIQTQRAKVLDWAGGKILAQLPADIVKAIPGDAAVEIESSGGTRGAGRDVAFEPRWEKIPLRDLRDMVSVGVCGSPVHDKSINVCHVDDRSGELTGSHQTGSGTDRYEFRLAHGMRLAACAMTKETTTHDAIPDAEATVRVDAATAIVDWRFKHDNRFKSLNYQVTCQAWAPAGLRQP
jgi:hypothetical protein